MSNFANWATLLVLTVLFLLGFVVFVLVGAIIVPAIPLVGVWMIVVGFMCLIQAFASLRMMEQYA